MKSGSTIQGALRKRCEQDASAGSAGGSTRIASHSRRRKRASVSTTKKTARPTARMRLKTRAVRSSSSTLISLQLTALQSGQLPTQLI